MRAVRLSPEKRKAQLISCAIRVFADHGIGHTNHAAVAAEAGVSPSAVFVYFPSHDELTEAVIHEVEKFYCLSIIEPTLEGMPAPESFEIMLMAFADSIDTHRDIARIWLDWSTSIRSGTWPQFLAFQKRAQGIVRKALKRGQAEGRIKNSILVIDGAELVVNLGHVIAQMKFSGSSRARIRVAIKLVLEAFAPN
ncbi:hypothetical protein BH10PSE12_BH10PSE12_12710 [soil metagenome]